MKKILFGLFVSLSLASSACMVDAPDAVESDDDVAQLDQLDPQPQPWNAVADDGETDETDVRSRALCQEDYDTCMLQSGDECQCRYNYQRCMHRQPDICQPSW